MADTEQQMLRSRATVRGDVESQLPSVEREPHKSSLHQQTLWRQRLLSLHHTWTLLPLLNKIVAIILFTMLLCHVLLGTLDVWFHSFGIAGHDRQETPSKTKSFAVVINTYKRPQMLREAVIHYADTCGRSSGVSQVFVVWAQQDESPPEPSSLFQSPSLPSDNRADVHILRVPKDSLNSRFLTIPRLQSDAIFMVDDDVRVSCPSLQTGFQAWNAFPSSMVGYYPRLASPPRHSTLKEPTFVYHGWPTVFLKSSFNFVLTKACFLHQRYLEIYSDPLQHPTEVLQYVDDHMNCEDVAMSLLVANYTRANNINGKPIYVEGSISDKGLFGGISTGSGHMSTRSECLTDLSRIYKQHGWGIPLSNPSTLAEQSWVHHYPGYWWQYKSSNFFEWFAFGNMFS